MRLIFCLILILGTLSGYPQEAAPLSGTLPLTRTGDLSAQMVAGIDTFLMHKIEASINERQKFWNRDFSSQAAYEKSVEVNRARLRKIIGASDARAQVTALELVGNTEHRAGVSETDAFTIQRVRWPVFEGVFAEGLWLQPKTVPIARVIAIPDADQIPELVSGLASGLSADRQFAKRLAENGCEVLVPVLLNRQDTWSGNARFPRFTNQPHREWIYRQAFELGRHIIGYEVQKVLAAVDWFSFEAAGTNGRKTKIGVIGYGEGGLIALYSAALDTRIDSSVVSGYFESRQRVWEEPIYRNVFGLLHEFGDAEIASLIAPRMLIVEHSSGAKIDGPPKPHDGRTGAAPGKLQPPDYVSVESEFQRTRTLLKSGDPKVFDRLKLITGTEGMATGPGSDWAMTELLNGMGVPIKQVKSPGKALTDLRADFDTSERQRRQVKELEDFTQKLCGEAERERGQLFWNKIKTSSSEEWKIGSGAFRTNFWEEVIGRFDAPSLPPNPRSRRIDPSKNSVPPGIDGYEVVLDVFPDVFAWGYLLVPKDLKPGERRPVVVCQHGLEGVPADVITEDQNSQAFRGYKAFANRLAERGFVVFAPHNPYRGNDLFRVLQRKANPLKKSLFSVIIAQHEQILSWLSGLPFVDSKRIGFYGLSYGGKTAMRVPAVLERYALSICSADFNEWVRKNVMVDLPLSYMFSGEYEMPEFDLGHTFNYAEMAALIAPRPFMVERGHGDGVGLDEWVAYEFAKVQRFYDALGVGDRTRIEFFNGPHSINGKGTFEFLHKHLDWPERKP